MKKIKLFSIFLILLQTLSFAQSQFQMRYGSSYYDRARKVIQTQDGNYLIIGQTNGFGSAGNAFILKVNTTGAILWLKDYSGINVDELRDIIELSDGNLVMCGSTNSYGAGSSDGFVMKTDNVGNIIFVNAYGGIYGEYFLKISVVGVNGTNGANGYYVAAFAQDTSTTQGTAIIRMDNQGNILWSKWASDWSAQGDWWPIDMTPIKSGGVVICGHSYGTDDIDIWKFSLTGNLIWSKRYATSPEGSANDGYSILENSSGEIMINCEISNSNTVAHSVDNCIIKLDSMGNFIYCKSYGGTYDDYSRTISNTSDGGVIMCGFTNSAGNGTNDASLIKLNANGSVQWAKAYGTEWVDKSSNAVQTSDGGYILTGQTWSVGSVYDSSKVHLVKVDSIGNSSCNDISWTPIVSNQSIITGIPTIPINFTFQKNSINWALNNRHFYTTDICIPASVNSINSTEDSWIISPNPFTSQTTISFNEEQTNTTLRITDVLGKEIKTMQVNGKQLIIEKGEMKEGIYFLQVMDEKKNIINKKIIIQ